MGGSGQHVNAHVLNINFDMSCRLYRVGVENHLPLPADLTDFLDRFNCTDFIVGKHNAYQCSIFPDRFCYLLRCDHSLPGNIQKRDFKAFFCKLVQRVQYCVVFDFCGYQMALAFFGTQMGSGNQRLVIRFTSAGCEVNSPCVTVQTCRNARSGIFQRVCRSLSLCVQTGSVFICSVIIFDHFCQCVLRNCSGCSIIGINLHHCSSFFPFVSTFVASIKQYTTSYYILSITYHENFTISINLLYNYVFRNATADCPNFFAHRQEKIEKIYGNAGTWCGTIQQET